MRFLLSVLLISFLVFFFGCKTTTEDGPTVSSSSSQPLEEPEEEVDEDKPQSIVVPVASLGDVSDTRKKILQNTLEDELKEHFMLISQERYEDFFKHFRICCNKPKVQKTQRLCKKSEC